MQSSSFEELLGPTLLRGDEIIDTSTQLTGKVVGLYFSAHWCGPCRGFTPKLASYYEKMQKKEKNFEIVFVSSDKTEDAFKDYFGSMPFLALPYQDRERKMQLSSTFKVRGIPSLIILDEDCSLITLEGRSCVNEDPEGDEFPWRPKPFRELLGSSFQGKTDEPVNTSAIEGKTLGIYFSAHWCPPCRMFTPKLVDVYNKLKEQGTELEIIYVPGDNNQEEFNQYYAQMPWLAIPFGDQRIGPLNRHFQINGIPCFVVVDSDGELINKSARDVVETDPEGVSFPWHPLPLADISSSTECMGYDINEKRALILFMEGADDHDQDALTDAVTPIAREYAEEGKARGDQSTLFFTAKNESSISKQLRKLLSLPDASDSPQASMVLLDIPDNGHFYQHESTEDITEDVIRDFIQNFKDSGRKQMKRS